MMKKKKRNFLSILIVLLVLTAGLVFIFSKKDNSPKEKNLSTMEGYYWYGYLDERKKITGSAEFEDYRQKIEGTERTKLFLQSTDYAWYALSNDTVSYEEIKDGDYIKVSYTGYIIEKYPAVIEKIMTIEKMN